MRFFAYISVFLTMVMISVTGWGAGVYDSNSAIEIQRTPLSVGPTETTTTVIEQDEGNQPGIDSTLIQTQTTAPSPPTWIPAWEQALLPNATSTTVVQDIETHGRHKEVRTVQKQTTLPSTNLRPAWEQALVPPSNTVTVTREKELVTPDGDGVTTVQSQTVGPIPVWDKMPPVDAQTNVLEETHQINGRTTGAALVESQMGSPLVPGELHNLD